jgi:hypothetical protein
MRISIRNGALAVREQIIRDFPRLSKYVYYDLPLECLDLLIKGKDQSFILADMVDRWKHQKGVTSDLIAIIYGYCSIYFEQNEVVI